MRKNITDWIILLPLTILFLMNVLTLHIGVRQHREVTTKIEEVKDDIRKVFIEILNLDVPKCPRQKVWHYIQLYDLLFPKVIYAQFIEETGWGTSRIFTEYLNPFGMKMPERRPTTQLNRTLDYETVWGIYSSIEAAVIDMHLWQQSIPQIQYMTQDEYIELLGRIYAPYDRDYTRNIRNLLNQIEPDGGD